MVRSRPETFASGERSPLIDEWDSESQRLGEGKLPIKQGLGIVRGRFSLAPHVVPENSEVAADEHKHLEHAKWLPDLPPRDHGWQWTVVMGDPGHRYEPPGTRSMGAIVDAAFDLNELGMIYVMRHLIVVTDKMKAALEAEAQ